MAAMPSRLALLAAAVAAMALLAAPAPSKNLPAEKLIPFDQLAKGVLLDRNAVNSITMARQRKWVQGAIVRAGLNWPVDVCPDAQATCASFTISGSMPETLIASGGGRFAIASLPASTSLYDDAVLDPARCPTTETSSPAPLPTGSAQIVCVFGGKGAVLVFRVYKLLAADQVSVRMARWNFPGVQ